MSRREAWLTCNSGERGWGWISEATGVIRERYTRYTPGLDGSEVDADNLCSGELVCDVDRPVAGMSAV